MGASLLITSIRPPCTRQGKSPWKPRAAARLLKSRDSRLVLGMAGPSDDKVVWVSTQNKEVLTAALESGISTLLVPHQQSAGAGKQVASWRQLGRFSTVTADEGGQLLDERGKAVGVLRRLAKPEDVSAAEREAGREGVVVVEALDWQIIPAENLVAAFQGAGARAQLLAVAGSCEGGRVMLEALEAGTHGVVLRTEDPKEVRQLAAYLAQRKAQRAQRLQYAPATVTRVAAVGMGDRACVDLASMLVPGEGLLVGSFARGLFLVHSECGESAYINSRPFRVNAGPVHSYVRMPRGRTAYLSELKTGAEVLVCDAAGRERTAIVGRVKIEARPLLLLEAHTPDGDTLSVLLQNAETVKLMGPSEGAPRSLEAPSAAGAARESLAAEEGEQHALAAAGGGEAGPAAAQSDEDRQQAGQQQLAAGDLARPAVEGPQIGSGSSPAGSNGAAHLTSPEAPPAASKGDQTGWRAIPVSSLREGDVVFVLLQPAARHTGVAILEQVREL